MVIYISVESVGIAPLSFFVASIQFFSLFFFISLVRHLFCFKKPAPGFIEFFEGFFVSLSPSLLF